MDLSKDFDCLPHALLLLKLTYYGLFENALNLIQNYLSNMKQCVKLGTFISGFKDICTGALQGSVFLGLFCLIFL